MPLQCFRCGKFMRGNCQNLCNHFKWCHAYHFTGQTVKCGQNDCPRSFNSFNSLRYHIRRSHSELLDSCPSSGVPCIQPSSIASTEGSLSVNAYDEAFVLPEDVEEEIHGAQSVTSVSETDVRDTFLQFISKLQSQPSVSFTTCQETTVGLQEIVREISSYCVGKIQNLSEKLGVDSTDDNVREAITDIENINSFFSDISTDKKRLKHLADRGLYLHPKQIILGNRTERRYDSNLGITKTVIVSDSFQCIAITDIVRNLYHHTDFKDLISHPQSKEQGKIYDFTDTESYKSHPVFSKFPDALQIHLFVDGFETTNELGSHTGIHKLEGLYVIFRNLPSKFLSKLSSIFPLALWYAEDVKTYGYDALLKPVVDEIKCLESTGIEISVNGKSTTLRGALVLFSADNLGAHSLFGFLEGFTAIKLCRLCEASKADAQLCYLESDFTQRSKESYDLAVLQSSSPDYVQKHTGIKKGCILNELNYFHVTENYVLDAMHDILEGVGPYELGLVLQKLIKENYLTLNQLNSLLLNFDYSSSDRNSKPPCLYHLPAVKVRAAECWCLLRNLTLIIGSKIPRGEPHWKLILLLLDIIDIVFAPVQSEGAAHYLKYLIEEHHHHFKQIFPDHVLKPKHHYMIHYSRCIQMSGPLVHYWCMRFEGKHAPFKETTKTVHCFKNICYTLMKRSQLQFAYNLLSKKLFSCEFESGPCSFVSVDALDERVASAVYKDLFLTKEDSVYVLSWMKFGHYTIRKACVLICEVVAHAPEFGSILAIISLSGKLYIVFEKYETMFYDEHFHAYEVNRNLDEVICLEFDKLEHVIPLKCQEVNYEGAQHFYISVRSRLF